MESPIAKRPKMSDHKINQSTQKSSDTKYPTIYVYVGGVQADDFEGICDDLRSAIHEAFRKHAYLRDSSLWNRPGYNKKTFMRYLDSEKSESLSEEELQSGLKFLSKCLHGYYENDSTFPNDLYKIVGRE
ncbi:hypothetical protein PV325_013340 [Microctonus aethiopoides]|nr:hypothetical protein PV325_013340 [Microctonus aethiopoides]